jgi:hypothetical protein
MTNKKPKRPADLPREAWGLWDESATTLVEAGLEVDVYLLSAMCDAWVVAERARHEIDTKGMTSTGHHGQEIQAPAVRMHAAAQDRFLRLRKEVFKRVVTVGSGAAPAAPSDGKRPRRSSYVERLTAKERTKISPRPEFAEVEAEEIVRASRKHKPGSAKRAMIVDRVTDFSKIPNPREAESRENAPDTLITAHGDGVFSERAYRGGQDIQSENPHGRVIRDHEG